MPKGGTLLYPGVGYPDAPESNCRAAGDAHRAGARRRIVSMGIIVVLATAASSGKLVEGLVGAAIFGLVGIIAQVVMMRFATLVIGIDMDALFRGDEFNYESLMVAAAQFALGIVVAVAIL